MPKLPETESGVVARSRWRPDDFCNVPVSEQEFERIVEQIAGERPWRGPIYALTWLVWRWSATLFTLIFCLATRQPWALTAALTLICTGLDTRYFPRAPINRLSDEQYVRKTCRGQYIEGIIP